MESQVSHKMLLCVLILTTRIMGLHFASLVTLASYSVIEMLCPGPVPSKAHSSFRTDQSRVSIETSWMNYRVSLFLKLIIQRTGTVGIEKNIFMLFNILYRSSFDFHLLLQCHHSLFQHYHISLQCSQNTSKCPLEIQKSKPNFYI